MYIKNASYSLSIRSPPCCALGHLSIRVVGALAATVVVAAAAATAVVAAATTTGPETTAVHRGLK